MKYHIDTSGAYRARKHVVVAIVKVTAGHIYDKKGGRAIVLNRGVIDELLKKYPDPTLHSAVIGMLVEGASGIEDITVCQDVRPISRVISGIEKIRPELSGKLRSIIDLRGECGEQGIRSAADAFANNVYRHFNKRRNYHRRKKIFEDGSVEVIADTSNSAYLRLVKLAKQINESK
jgi:hypothetical protein